GRSDELVRGAMEEIRDLLAQASAELETLESVDIDALMRRLDELSALSKRYGSVSEALNYLAQKEKELARYESFDLEIKRLEREVSEAKEEALAYAALLSEARHRVAMKLSDLLTQLLRELILPEAKVEVHETALGPMGYDEVVMMIGATELSKLSSGEFSRVRLAILAAWLEVGLDERGVLFLDEVDANLSGDESMSVGRILRRLARHYQIFAISHQPQMTSLAERHFLVIKEDGVSRVRQIEGEERVAEIARIISHGTITPQALAYARSMLEANKEIA
ncbi:MAG: ATPase, partial [Campylobacterales bacterium]